MARFFAQASYINVRTSLTFFDTPMMKPSPAYPAVSIFVILQFIGVDVIRRIKSLCVSAQNAVILVISLLPIASAQQGTNLFHPIYTSTPEINASVENRSEHFYLNAWVARGNMIRSGHTNAECLGNLSWALQNLGALSAAEYSGAAGALSLLPTAGALVSAPTKEMWIVYRLMPIAGVLSMFLSLGGTITPSKLVDYDPKSGISYGGIMPSKNPKDELDTINVQNPDRSDAEKFAATVRLRAMDDVGGSQYRKVWLGVLAQVFLIGIIMTAMRYGQLGSVISWWCGYWGWMYLWYLLVVVTSVFENIMATPFAKTWTMRISKAPGNINISDSASSIIDDRFPNVLDRLSAGVNTRNRLTIRDGEPSTSSSTCFYVVISVEGITNVRATLQVISKACTIAVFAFGTTLFASATLMSVMVTLFVLGLVLGSGVLGRVAAMWIASEMNKSSKPILHALVKNQQSAGEYVEEILQLNGLLIEIMGHVIIDQKIVLRRNEWLCLASYLGLLAPPIDIVKLAARPTMKTSPQLGPNALLSGSTIHMEDV